MYLPVPVVPLACKVSHTVARARRAAAAGASGTVLSAVAGSACADRMRSSLISEALHDTRHGYTMHKQTNAQS